MVMSCRILPGDRCITFGLVFQLRISCAKMTRGKIRHYPNGGNAEREKQDSLILLEDFVAVHFSQDFCFPIKKICIAREINRNIFGH